MNNKDGFDMLQEELATIKIMIYAIMKSFGNNKKDIIKIENECREQAIDLLKKHKESENK